MFAEVVLPLPLDKAFHYSIPDNLKTIVKPGVRVSIPFGNKKLIGYVSSLVEESYSGKVKDIFSVIDRDVILTDEMILLGKWIAASYLCSLGEAFAAIVSPALGAGKKKEALVVPFEPESKPLIAHIHSEAQREAIKRISASLNAGKPETFLLHGITSSGKTEVYLSAIEETLKLSKSAIFLLPEISLTPHFIRIIKERFHDKVGIWHSGLSKQEKFAAWENAKKGKTKIMIGPRSAVFAPFEKLGLIVIDEEHESTYKQEQKPAYHAREVALERARLSNAVVILGSATPSIESYYRAKSGEFILLELKERVGSGILPPVRIVDSRKQYRQSKILSEPLVDALNKTLLKREQAIIFLNRRGFAPGVTCENCNAVFKCPHCSISLVYHSDDKKLKCHYCGYSTAFPEKCPTCKSGDIRVFGVGTQKVEQELKKIFPQSKVVRLDRDSASKKGVYEKAYDDFRKENFDILLGTQMVAKGFDFPRVTLVGVIDADTSLYFPDFRSAERTFQLLTQVAGRSGRSHLGGEVIIQSTHQEHYALALAKNHDYNSFYDKEVEFRRQMGYPPFTVLCNIIVRGKNEQTVKEVVLEIHNTLLQINLVNNFEILGPSPASRVKLHGMFRWQILLKGKKSGIIQSVLDIRKTKVHSGVILTFDIDPFDIL